MKKCFRFFFQIYPLEVKYQVSTSISKLTTEEQMSNALQIEVLIASNFSSNDTKDIYFKPNLVNVSLHYTSVTESCSSFFTVTSTHSNWLSASRSIVNVILRFFFKLRDLKINLYVSLLYTLYHKLMLWKSKEKRWLQLSREFTL